ncbi:MAG: right-handed parallel beta-helix repeat-containing protein [Clostridia bacterium]|nr:right-handed parallel beta-helix repeat-containing protein [Clostridia bacterium]
MIKRIISLSVALLLVFACSACSPEVNTLSGDRLSLYAPPEESVNYLMPNIDVVIGDEEGLVDVKSHGAKGDGIADDTAAVNAAIAAMGESGGILYFSHGTYVINSNVTVPENIAFAVATSTKIKLAENATLKVNSSDLYLPKRQNLTGKGLYDFRDGVNYAFPEWFSSGGVGIAKAITAADTVYLSKITYNIEDKIVIPQERDIKIIGVSNYGTKIDSYSDVMFEYIYESGKASTVEFSYIKVTDSAGGNFLVFNGNPETKEGTAKFNNMAFWGCEDAVILKNCSNNLFKEIYTMGTGYLAIFEGGVNDTTFEQVLCSSNKQGLIVADGANENTEKSQNLYFYFAASVWAYNIDYNIKNYDNVQFINSSGDLGAGETNEASIKLENVNGFTMLRSWCASNSGISYAASAGIAKIRVGVWLVNCTDITIKGNSIQNHDIAIRIDGGSGEKPIVVEGNVIQASGSADFVLNGAKNVTIRGNAMYSTGQHERLKYGDRTGNYNLKIGDPCKDILFEHNITRGVIRGDDGAKKKYNGITVGENHGL